MFSAIILICDMNLVKCGDMVSPTFFRTEQQCMFITQQEVDKMKKANPENQYAFKCVDWGTAL